MFGAVYLLAERLRTERMIDVFHTVKALQLQRPLLINKLVSSSFYSPFNHECLFTGSIRIHLRCHQRVPEHFDDVNSPLFSSLLLFSLVPTIIRLFDHTRRSSSTISSIRSTFPFFFAFSSFHQLYSSFSAFLSIVCDYPM